MTLTSTKTTDILIVVLLVTYQEDCLLCIYIVCMLSLIIYTVPNPCTDSSLEPRPIPTQDDDLLIRIDLPPGAVIPGEIRVRVKLTPEDEDAGEPLEMSVDGVFSNVSTFYPFIPASQLRFTQFYIQVLLVVNNVEGPLNPPTVTGNQFIGN